MQFDEIYSIHLVTQWIPCNQRYHGFRMQLWKHRGSRLKNFSLIVLSFYFFLQGTISRWPDLRWRESKLPSACNQQPAFGRAKFESLISCTNSQQIWTSLFQKDDSNLFQQSRQRGKAESTVSESLIFDWYYFVQDAMISLTYTLVYSLNYKLPSKMVSFPTATCRFKMLV